MGQTTWKHHARVASFKVKTTKGIRVFTPVNDRAKKLVKKLGKRTRVTAEMLKPYKDYYKLRQYVGTELKAIRV
jgi:hypothetical protein